MTGDRSHIICVLCLAVVTLFFVSICFIALFLSWLPGWEFISRGWESNIGCELPAAHWLLAQHFAYRDPERDVCGATALSPLMCQLLAICCPPSGVLEAQRASLFPAETPPRSTMMLSAIALQGIALM